MRLNPLQHMRLAELLRSRAQSVPMSLKGRYLAFAALSVALARYPAKNPHLSPRNQQLQRRKDRELSEAPDYLLGLYAARPIPAHYFFISRIALILGAKPITIVIDRKLRSRGCGIACGLRLPHLHFLVR